MEKIFQKESPYRKLAYAESFRKMVEKHPRLLSIFRDLENRMKEKVQAGKASVGSSLEDQGMKVTIIDKPQSAKPLGSYFKAEVDGDAFFVKTVPGFWGGGKGAKELASIKKSKELLKDLKDVETVDFQFGYEDNVSNTTYFVSRWEDGVLLDDYLKELESKKNHTRLMILADNIAKEQSNLISRFQEIRSLLSKHKLYDIWEHNVFYNPKTKKLKVFDIHS